MQENSQDYQVCIELALENAEKRIKSLNRDDKKCVQEEYREWIKDGFNQQTILLLRDDPII